MFESISFVMYNVESTLLSSYVVWRKDLLIHTMLLRGFILLGSFVTPAGISMGITLRTEFFPYYEYLYYTDRGNLLNVQLL